ncbi:MAG: ECF transporter S component [Aerococcus sp.]|nr:ECF transporter S component [Aerococcus sp.]
MKRKFSARHLALLALLSALAVVGRILMVPLPNIQPITVLVIIITLTMSVWDGLAVATVSLVISNVFLGMGPWTLFQLLSYAAIVLLTRLLMTHWYQSKQQKSRFLIALWAGICGLLYGIFISGWNVWFYHMPSFFGYYVVGVPFDLAHAAGNIVFYLLLEPTLAPIIHQRYPYYR